VAEVVEEAVAVAEEAAVVEVVAVVVEVEELACATLSPSPHLAGSVSV
jgi:hypothetical protein